MGEDQVLDWGNFETLMKGIYGSITGRPSYSANESFIPEVYS